MQRINRHGPNDLKMLQSLPLEEKINMTKERIKAWYESWTRFEIENLDTGKIRYVTWDTRKSFEPPTKDNEWIKAGWPGAVYVSFSGGKDSTVLKHIVDSMYDDVPAVFVNTGLEYPEIQKFAKAQKNVVVIRPELRFDEVIKKYGYPAVSKDVAQCIHVVKHSKKTGRNVTRMMAMLNGTMLGPQGRISMYNKSKWKYLLDADFDVSNMCCHVMKKKPAKAYEKETGRRAIIGTMAQESLSRQHAWIAYGCNAFDRARPTSQPLSFWTEQDILHYIKKYDVPYCSVYGDIVIDDEPELDGQMNALDYLGDYSPEDKLKTTGCNRTGCIFCMFGCHLEKEPNRFQRLKKTHPRQYEYCIGGGEMVDGKWKPNKEGLGLGHVLDYIGVKYD